MVQSFPHRGGAVGNDRWGDYGTEFGEINAFVNASALGRKMVLLSADMHAIAADDGTHSRLGAMELVAAPLDQTSNGGGGSWTVGPIAPAPGAGQFGHVQVTDAGNEITVTFTGRDHEGNVLATLARTFPAGAPSAEPQTTAQAYAKDGWRASGVRAGPELLTARTWAWQGEFWS